MAMSRISTSTAETSTTAGLRMIRTMGWIKWIAKRSQKPTQRRCKAVTTSRLASPICQLKIRQSVHPTADQGSALDDLSAATSQASDMIRSSCPTAVPLTPVGRLDAAQQRLVATITAIQIIRSPFARFYDSLSDEQKRQFNAMKASTEGTRSANNLASLCSQQPGGFANVPVQRIEQVVQPNEQQQSAFKNLKRAAQTAADQLRSSCPTAVPQSPVERVDTVEVRLNTIVEATRSIRPDLENFYASLSDGQKARFNVMGPLPNSASSQLAR